ncbi:hypothetical protein BGZ76_008925 [Entomortierella beljakovae]|nr:hypothetical protein BGZ76_008925 [Entomortierella beljakovae]
MPLRRSQERASAIPHSLQQSEQLDHHTNTASSHNNLPIKENLTSPNPTSSSTKPLSEPRSSSTFGTKSKLSNEPGQQSEYSMLNGDPQKLRVAIIGSGLAGLTTARLLSSLHLENGDGDTGIEVHLFEKTSQTKINAATVPVTRPCEGCTQSSEVDDSNIEYAEDCMDVTTNFFPEYHPYLMSLYQSVGIKLHDANNTVSCSNVHLDSKNHSVVHEIQDPYFSSRSYKIGSRMITLPDIPPFSIINPFPFGRRVLEYCRITMDYIRMVATSKEFMSKGRMMDVGKHPIEWGNGRMLTFREFLEDGGYSHEFSSYLIPRIASVCACSFERIMEYPACVVLEYVARCFPFGRMKALMPSGLNELSDKLSDSIGTVHYNTTIRHIRKEENPATGKPSVMLTDSFGVERHFDHVIFATPANQTAATLAGYAGQCSSDTDDSEATHTDATEHDYTTTPVSINSIDPEQPFYHQIKTLLKFPYERTKVVCHTDMSFLPKNPLHWRFLNITKPFSADILASPLCKIAKELEPEMELRSKDAKILRPSIFSLKTSPQPPPNKLKQRRGSLSWFRDQFEPLSAFISKDASRLPAVDMDPHSQNSVMATYIMGKTSGMNSSIQFLQTINPIYPPHDNSVISSTWFDRVVVNSSSIKAVDELQHLMEQQTVQLASENLEGSESSSRGSYRKVRELSSLSGAPTPISDRVWFVGSYSYPGIPLSEGCVASAVRVAEQIIAAEPSRRLALPLDSPQSSLWMKNAINRERQQRLRREYVGRRGTKRQAKLANMYFQARWKVGLEESLLDQNDRYVKPFTFNAALDVAWIFLLYLVAMTKWLIVFLIESFGGRGDSLSYS